MYSLCLTNEAFAIEIAIWQKKNNFFNKDCDGIIGKKTYTKLLRKNKIYAKKQFIQALEKYQFEEKLVPKHEILSNFLEGYSKLIVILQNINDLTKITSGKNATAHSAILIGRIYRNATKSINSMKVIAPYVKTIKAIGISGIMADSVSINIRWKKVQYCNEEIDSDLLIDTYMNVLAIIGEMPKATGFSIAAKGVSTIFNTINVHVDIGKKLNIVSDKLGDILYENLPKWNPNEKPNPKYTTYPRYDLRQEDLNLKKANYRKRLNPN